MVSISSTTASIHCMMGKNDDSVVACQKEATTTANKLSSRYFDRLQLDPDLLDLKPTIEKLQLLQESHLNYIPFENLSQHGCSQPATLDVEKIANKILDNKRGGFCFELNGLFAEFLEEIGYTVTRVPSYVNSNGTFQENATHLVLIVSAIDNDMQERLFFVDVGFGEPPIHPLRYVDNNCFDQEQITPDGMRSKIIRSGSDVFLLWLYNNNWMYRLRWDYKASMLGIDGPKLSYFESNLSIVLQKDSIFTQKIITCLLTREMKYTVAGNRYKITGPPRKYSNSNDVIQYKTFESEFDAQQILLKKFGIAIDETSGLDFTKSLAADPLIWSHQ